MGKGSSTIYAHQDLLRISVALLSLYFQMLNDMFIVISLSIPQHTLGTGTALLGLPVMGPMGSLLLVWVVPSNRSPLRSPLDSPLLVSLCFILCGAQCSALNVFPAAFIPQRSTRPLPCLTRPVFNLKYISRQLGY